MLPTLNLTGDALPFLRLSHSLSSSQISRWFHLFAGNPSIVNSPSHRESKPGGGSYSCNPFTTRPTQRWLLHEIFRVKNIPFKVDVLDDETAASLRKFYLTYYDIRAVIMDLVSKLDEMRHLDHLPKYRQQILSLQVLKIYSPLAHAVGIWQKGRSCILLRLALLFIYSVSAPTDTGCVQQQRIALGFGILRVSVLLRI